MPSIAVVELVSNAAAMLPVWLAREVLDANVMSYLRSQYAEGARCPQGRTALPSDKPRVCQPELCGVRYGPAAGAKSLLHRPSHCSRGFKR